MSAYCPGWTNALNWMIGRIQRYRDMEIQRYRDTEIQRCRDTEIQRYRDTEIQIKRRGRE
jgi:hypothetical protein